MAGAPCIVICGETLGCSGPGRLEEAYEERPGGQLNGRPEYACADDILASAHEAESFRV